MVEEKEVVVVEVAVEEDSEEDTIRISNSSSIIGSSIEILTLIPLAQLFSLETTLRWTCSKILGRFSLGNR